MSRSLIIQKQEHNLLSSPPLQAGEGHRKQPGILEADKLTEDRHTDTADWRSTAFLWDSLGCLGWGSWDRPVPPGKIGKGLGVPVFDGSSAL